LFFYFSIIANTVDNKEWIHILNLFDKICGLEFEQVWDQDPVKEKGTPFVFLTKPVLSSKQRSL